MSNKTTAVLGATPNRERYANMAVRLLVEKGHSVIPVNPAHETIEGLKTVSTLAQITQPVDTLTLYISGAKLPLFVEQIIALKPGRIIFNPGTENDVVKAQLQALGLHCIEACTLVLLKTGQF